LRATRKFHARGATAGQNVTKLGRRGSNLRDVVARFLYVVSAAIAQLLAGSYIESAIVNFAKIAGLL